MVSKESSEVTKYVMLAVQVGCALLVALGVGLFYRGNSMIPENRVARWSPHDAVVFRACGVGIVTFGMLILILTFLSRFMPGRSRGTKDIQQPS